MPEEKSVLLQHMLLSHHGQPEFGAAVVPKCAEAELLSLIDTMDSRMEIYRETLEEVPEGAFSKRIFAPGQKGLPPQMSGRAVLVCGVICGEGGSGPPPRALLALALRRELGIAPLPRMERAPGGKPFFPDLPQVRFSPQPQPRRGGLRRP